MGDTLITVEVAYATPDKQMLVAVQVPLGTVAREAVKRADVENDLRRMFPGLDIANCAIGIFGRLLGSRGLPSADEYVLRPWDRVEIYRPLLADPKEIRQRRAAKARSKPIERG